MISHDNKYCFCFCLKVSFYNVDMNTGTKSYSGDPGSERWQKG